MTPDFLDSLIVKLEGWVEQAVLLAPNAVVAIVIAVGFAVASRGVRRLVCRVFTRMSDNEPIAQVVAQIARVSTVVLGLFLALTVLELDKAVTSMLAGVGVLGLALGFAFQDTAANLVSGVYMAARRPINIDDIIEVAGQLGTVVRIDLRSTLLRTFDGLTVFIPNKEIFQGIVVNYTDTQERRVDISVGVAYSDDLVKARDVAIDAVRGIEHLAEDREVEVFYTEFGDSSINFTLRFWLSLAAQPNWFAARSEAIIRVKKAFDREGITIPFPIRTLDFGADQVGGQLMNARPQLRGLASAD